MTAEEIIEHFGLKPLPEEGGYFGETYRSSLVLAGDALPEGYGGPRSLSTAIYYLLTPASFSAMHRLRGDEVFHFYLGDPVEMLRLHADGSGALVTLGCELRSGMRPQVLVPGGTWQGLCLVEGGRWALLGTTVAPGFEVRDFELGDAAALTEAYPDFAREIARRTR